MLPPVGEIGVHLAIGAGLTLPLGVVDVLKLKWIQVEVGVSDIRLVCLTQLVPEDPEGLCIEGDVMGHQGDDLLSVCHPEQRHPQRWLSCQIKTALLIFGHDDLRPPLGIVAVAAEVVEGNRD